MRYRTSCFNPTLARHNLRRFWPLPVLIFLFFALVMGIDYHTNVADVLSGRLMDIASQMGSDRLYYKAENTLASIREAAYSFGPMVVTLQLFSALVSALLVMLHIHSRKQIQFYHGLPMKRRCIYITNVVTGGLMALVPVLLAEGIVLIMAAAFEVELFPVFQLMGITAASFIMFYAMAILSCVLAGQTFGALLIYAGINCVVVVLLSGVTEVIRYLVLGFDDYVLLEVISILLTPVATLVSASTPLYSDVGNGIPYGFAVLPFLGYALVAILILILSGWLYQRRRGETAGEMISFPMIRRITVVLVALMAGFGGTVLLVMSFSVSKDLSFPVIAAMVLGFLLIGWIATEMVTRKTFRVFEKKNILSGLSLVALVLLFLTGAKLDVVGYVNRTPNMDRVVSAQLMYSGVPVEVDPEDALKFHEFVLEHKEELSNSTSTHDYRTLHVDYYRADGTELLSRTYYLKDRNETAIMDTFLELMSKQEYVYRSWFRWGDGTLAPERIASTTVSSYVNYSANVERNTPYILRDGGDYGAWNVEMEEAMLIYSAICQDIEEGNLETYYGTLYGEGAMAYGSVEFVAYEKPYDPSMGSYETYKTRVSCNYHNISIYPTMTYTLEALEKLGFTVNLEALK